jgi:hypothetical protein
MAVWPKYQPILGADMLSNPYIEGLVEPYPMVNVDVTTWLQDLDMFMQEGPVVGFRDKFFRKVATPIWVAWAAYKSTDPDRFKMAQDAISNCAATDWKKACSEWLDRRMVS